MKTKIVFLLCLFCVVTIKAQGYKPVITDSITKWAIVDLPDWHESQEWDVTGDTTFNSVKYKKVSYFYSYSLYSLYNETLADSLWRVNPPENVSNYNRYVRQTDDNSKLYIYDEDTKKEYLVYDMGLQKGDTFFLPLNSQYYFENSNNNKNYSTVDSIYVKDNFKHIQLNSISGYYQLKLTFIESIGPNLGIFYIYGGEGVNRNVFCLNCFQNKNTFYKHSFPLWQYPCAFNWSLNSTPIIQDETYKLIQTKEKIIFHFKSFDDRIIWINDLTGRTISIIKSQNTDNISIDINNLGNGCFIFHITDKKGTKATSGKILITK